MPRIGSRSLMWAFAACLGLWVFLGQVQEASANLSYRGTWETNENDKGRLIQLYNHTLVLYSKQDLIGSLTSEESVNYSKRWEEEGVTNELLSPGAALRLSGDIFFASLAVNSVKNLNTESTQVESDTFVATWASSWKKRFIPELRANYDNSRQRADSLNRRIDDVRQSVGAQINWDLDVAQIFYSYRRTDGDFINYQDVSDNNLARINATRVWLNNRLRVTLGHEYNKSTSTREIPFINNTFTNVTVTLPQVDTGTDVTPDDADETMLVAAPFLLNDADPLVPPAYSISTASNPNCIRIRTNGQQVDRIFLYTQANYLTTPLGVSFRVFTNDDPSFITPWSQQVSFNWHYDSINQRFILDLPAVKANYVKLVVDLAGPITINFTEVQAEQIVHGVLGSTLSTSRNNQADKSNFTLDFRLNRSVAFFYDFLVEQEEVNSVTSNERQGHNAGVRLQNSAGDLKSSLSYSLSRQSYLANPEFQTETYLVSVNKVFLPTLSCAIGGSRENISLAGAKVSTRNRFTFYADAKLYPDLTSQLEAAYWDLKSSSSDVGSGNQDNLNTKITITSRFRPSLSASIYDTYDVHNQSEQVSKKLNTTGLSFNWQVSDVLSVNAAVSMMNGNLVHDEFTYSTGLVAGMGSGFEFKVIYSLRTNESKSQSGRASLRWTSAKHVAWEIGCDYAENDLELEQNVYKFFSQLTVNFATL